MPAMDARGILRQGLIDRNPGFVQLLGLCPLLAVSTSVARALGLGLATMVVLATSNGIAAVAGPHLPREVRLAVFVTTLAAAVTAVELAMAAWWPGLHASLGIFLPLIVTNCLLLARAESFASREPVPRALLDGFAMGAGFLLALLALGASRELLGRGSLGADLHLLLGERFAGAGWQLFPEDDGWLLALLPPGAFILLGLMLALGNAWGAMRRPAAAGAAAPTTARVAP
jgi:electron transport complex protein RnfE